MHLKKNVKDTDDLDGDLFKSKNLSKTMPSSSYTNKSASVMQRNKSKTIDVFICSIQIKQAYFSSIFLCLFYNNSRIGFSFDDDPLADFDALIGKPTTAQKPAVRPTISKQISFDTDNKRPSHSNIMSSTMPSSSGPGGGGGGGGYTPSGNKSNLKSNLFDDIEDNGLLGSVCFFSIFSSFKNGNSN